ncbi:MAG TPA: CBS domain-containing protein [Chloroflexi bacterium]|jgi:CBS domain-containing protein|nr:CBS domain-containing protein [Chloroflexota bacterium]
MKTVRQLLDSKGYNVWSIRPDATVYEALKLMADKNVGAVLVIDEQDHLVGVLSERDYARKVILQGRFSQDTLVRDIMTDRVVYVRPEQRLEDCMALMTDKRIRHLPVMEDGKLLGVVSIGDVVKTIISEQEFVIEQLENYITGVPA